MIFKYIRKYTTVVFITLLIETIIGYAFTLLDYYSPEDILFEYETVITISIYFLSNILIAVLASVDLRKLEIKPNIIPLIIALSSVIGISLFLIYIFVVFSDQAVEKGEVKGGEIRSH